MYVYVGYIEFGRLLNKTGRPIVYSCSWPAYEEPLGVKVSLCIKLLLALQINFIF